MDELILTGEQLFNEKKYEQVVQLLTDDVLSQHKNVALYILLARSFNGLRKMDKALDYAERAISVDPNAPQAYITLGNVFIAEKNYQKAIEFYNKAISLQEDFIMAYYNRGNAFLNLKKYDEALIDYNRVLQLDANNIKALNNRGSIWYNIKEYDRAISDCNKVLKLDSENLRALRIRGSALNYIKEYDKAIVDYNKAIKLDNKNWGTYNNRGNAWHNKKDYDKAIIDYTKAIRLEKNGGVYVNRGNAWVKKKEYEKAIRDYNLAIEIDNANKAAYKYRGNVWLLKGDNNKAIEDYTLVISIDDRDEVAYYGRAQAYERLDKIKEAFNDYNYFLELTNDKNSFSAKNALAKLNELNKKEKNPLYDDISGVIDRIKNLLVFNEDCVTHYTTLTTSRLLILNDSKFRLSEGTFLNDTSEGRTLFDYLNFHAVEKSTDRTLAEPFTEKPFIGSFVAEIKHDDLTLWRMYGKEDKIEARGCALTISRQKFIEEIQGTIKKHDVENTFSSFNQFVFYRVAYIAKKSFDMFTLPGNEENEDELNSLMKDLKEKIDKVEFDKRIEIAIRLNDIAYLFKSSEYQYEHEVRLIIPGVGFDKNIEDTPRVFIEVADICSTLHKITLGPKIERAEEWASAFNYKIKQKNEDQDINIVISHLPFK